MVKKLVLILMLLLISVSFVVAQPSPDSDDRILFDVRDDIRQAESFEQISRVMGFYPESKWNFTTDWDGQGTHALRADWQGWGTECGDTRAQFKGGFPEHVDEAYIQLKMRMGRTQSGGGIGEIDAFDVTNHNCGNAARKMILVHRENYNNRISFVYHGPSPATPNIGDSNFDLDNHVGEVLTKTLYVKRESSDDANDGELKLWINDDLIGNETGLDLGTEKFMSFTAPTVFRAPRINQSEYFWDIVAWDPDSRVTGEEWSAKYYDDENLDNLVTTKEVSSRRDGFLSMDWGLNSPHLEIPEEHWSASFTKNVSFDSGEYSFTLGVDDGARVYIDGEQLFDEWRGQSYTTFTEKKNMSAGEHEIRVEYFEGWNVAQLDLSWNKTDGSGCVSEPEVCDGVDNDCDGEIDEEGVCDGEENTSEGNQTASGREDVNGDGNVNIFDLVQVARNIGSSDSSYDLNGDGSVNVFDLISIVQRIVGEKTGADGGDVPVPEMPGHPEFYEVSGGVNVSWGGVENAEKYTYTSVVENGETTQTSVVLPLSDGDWFCVRAVNSEGVESEDQACNTYTARNSTDSTTEDNQTTNKTTGEEEVSGSGNASDWYRPPETGDDSIIWDYRAGGNRDLQEASSYSEAYDLFDGVGLWPDSGWALSEDYDGNGTHALVAKWTSWGGTPGDVSRRFRINVGQDDNVSVERAKDVVMYFKVWPGRRPDDGVGWGELRNFDPFNEEDNSTVGGGARKTMRWIGRAWDGSLAKGTGLLRGAPEPGTLTLSAKPQGDWWNIRVFSESVYSEDWENQVVEFAYRLKCESSKDAEDGALGIWADIPSLGEESKLVEGEIGCEYIMRFGTPTVMRSPQINQSEYWYDMVVWEAS